MPEIVYCSGYFTSGGEPLSVNHPLPFSKTGGNRRMRNRNTGADSDYLPPESFDRRSVRSYQDRKLSSSPDSADRIRGFPLFHPFAGFVVRIRNTHNLTGFGNNRLPPADIHRFPRCRIRFQDLSVHPASFRPADCQCLVQVSFQCACSRVGKSAKISISSITQSSRLSQRYRQVGAYRGYWDVF